MRLMSSEKYRHLKIATLKTSWSLSLLHRIRRDVLKRDILKFTSLEADLQRKGEVTPLHHHSMSCTLSGQRIRSPIPRGLRFTRLSIRLMELRCSSQGPRGSSRTCRTRGTTHRRTSGCSWTTVAPCTSTTLRRAQSDTDPLSPNDYLTSSY